MRRQEFHGTDSGIRLHQKHIKNDQNVPERIENVPKRIENVPKHIENVPERI